MVEDGSVNFRCGDGEIVPVPKNLANEKFGKHFCDLINNASAKSEEVSVPRIKKPCMLKVIEWCTHMLTNDPPNIEPPLCHSDLKMVVDDWSSDYIDGVSKV